MAMAAEKALDECSWDSIEWLFQPTTVCELMLRLNMGDAIEKALVSQSPAAMPRRFRSPYREYYLACKKREEFYRKLKKLHEERTQRT